MQADATQLPDLAQPMFPQTPRRSPLIALQAADSVSQIGNLISQIALPWFVLQTTGSAAETGLTGFFGSVPLVLAAFFGGTIVDRLGFKRASITSDLASAVCVALIPILHLTVGLAFWQLLILVFLGALLDTPGLTAREALLPEVAAEAQMPLERVNSIDDTVQSLGMLAGPALAGILIAAMGPVNVLWFNVATFLLSAGLVYWGIPARLVKKAADNAGQATTKSYLGEMMQGLRFVWSERLIRTIVMLASVLILFSTPLYAVIMPVYMQKTYGDATNLGLFLSAEGGGLLLGAVTYGIFGQRLPKRPVLIGALLGISLSFIGLASLPPLLVILIVGFLGGLASGPINPLLNTVIQQRTPPELRGRTIGTMTAFSAGLVPIGILAAGLLIEIVGVQLTLAGMAACFFLVSLSTLWNKTLTELDQPAHPKSPLD